MKSLQNKYNLIKEGKGNKELFLKEAKSMFPNIVTNVLTYDQAIHNLVERGVITENQNTSINTKAEEPNWFKVFNENVDVKATLKQTDKSVEEKEIAGYDYKDKKNNNNISTAEILTGYYVEMKDPKNADKTETEIKTMVFKNLEKDPLHYVKTDQFGVKDLGYTDEAPGLGKTKEVKGKYASSGMEPVKINESIYSDSDGDFDAQEKDKQMAYYYYDKGLEAYSEGDYLKADKYRTTALKYGSHVGWGDQDLPPYDSSEKIVSNRKVHQSYDNMYGVDSEAENEFFKIKKRKGLQEYNEYGQEVSFYYQFEEIEYKGEMYNVQATITAEVEDGDITGSHPDDPSTTTDKTVTWQIEEIHDIERYDPATQEYVPTSLSFDDKLEIKKILETSIQYKDDIVNTALDAYFNSLDEDLSEATSNTDVKKKLMPNKEKGIADAMVAKSTLEKIAKQVWDEAEISKAKEIFKQHVENSGINSNSKEQMLSKIASITRKSDLDYYLANALLRYEKLNVKENITVNTNITTLTEAKKRAIEKHLKEIEKLGEIAAVDHKIQKVQEKIDELENKITMTESDGFAEMIDKTAVKELKKDIALLEKRKKMFEAQKAKLAKKVSGQGKPQTHAGGGVVTGMSENQPLNLREMVKNVIATRKAAKAAPTSIKESKLRSLISQTIKEELNEYGEDEFDRSPEMYSKGKSPREGKDGMDFSDAKKLAYSISREGVVQHVNELPDGSYEVSDWYDADTTVISYENGIEL